MNRPSARQLWRAIEPIHAITYFAEACRARPAELGLKGFWHGYFANRAAPMGPVGADVVIATFFNFHRDMVRRAIPSAWVIVDPAVVCQIRSRTAGAVLTDTVVGVDQCAHATFESLQRVIDRADGAGRVLFSANRQLLAEMSREPAPTPAELLWQQCSVLREHRGDGHVHALLAYEMGACTAHVLFAATSGLPAEMLQNGRGWSKEDWARARAELVDRGLVDQNGATEHGLALRAEIERQTDELAGRPYEVLDDDELHRLFVTLGSMADAVLAAGIINFPNPMGLPGPSRTAEH